MQVQMWFSLGIFVLGSICSLIVACKECCVIPSFILLIVMLTFPGVWAVKGIEWCNTREMDALVFYNPDHFKKIQHISSAMIILNLFNFVATSCACCCCFVIIGCIGTAIATEDPDT